MLVGTFNGGVEFGGGVADIEVCSEGLAASRVAVCAAERDGVRGEEEVRDVARPGGEIGVGWFAAVGFGDDVAGENYRSLV